jgi:ketosteroid isomerase-like protein
MPRVFVATLSGLVLMLGCGCSAAPDGTAPPAPAVQAPAVAATTTTPEPAVQKPALEAPGAPITEAQVRATFNAWLVAQNSGDFEAYSRLYAERFQGIKRVGVRERRFDRAGWLDDRERMFAKPMQVEAADVQVAVVDSWASVTFEQHFKTGNFEDRGRKVLRIAPKAGALVITSEELLESRLVRGVSPAPLGNQDFMFVVQTRRTFVVLSGEADEAWAVGHPEIEAPLDTTGIVTTTRRVRPGALPAALRETIPAEVRAYGDAGLVCDAKLGELRLLRHVTTYADDPPSVPEARRAVVGWRESPDQTLLVGVLEPEQGSCGPALWAQAKLRAVQPTVFASAPVAETLQAQVLAAVRALPRYKAVQREYRKIMAKASPEDPAPPGAWENYEGASPTFKAFRSVDRSFVTFAADVGACTEFGSQLWLLFEQRGDQLVLLSDANSPDAAAGFAPLAVFDANGDGLLELVGGGWRSNYAAPDALMRHTPSDVVFIRDIYPPFHACGC